MIFPLLEQVNFSSIYANELPLFIHLPELVIPKNLCLILTDSCIFINILYIFAASKK